MCASRPFPDLCKSRDQGTAGGTGDRFAEKRANATVFILIIYTLCKLQIIYNRETDAYYTHNESFSLTMVFLTVIRAIDMPLLTMGQRAPDWI